jgi:hypothetical protein
MNPLIELIPKLCMIRNKGGGIIPFQLYDWQVDFLNNLQDKNILNKARQIGASTLTCAMFYLKTVARTGVNTKIIANKKEIATTLLDTVSIIHSSLPPQLKPQCRHESRFEFFFDGINSRISISSSAKDAGRGETIHNLLCSEVAFWENAEETMLGLLECVPKGGLIVVESTPNGVGNWFHSQYVRAEQNEIDWKAHKHVYDAIPEYREPGWKENKIKEKGIQGFAQEYGGDFLLSQRTVFDRFEYDTIAPERIELRTDVKVGEIIDPVTGAIITREQAEHVGMVLEDPVMVFNPVQSDTAPLRVWKKPIEGHEYVIGADVAEGLKKGDYSCAYVIDTSTFEAVACWHGHIAPDLFGDELILLATWYNQAIIGWETNNHGIAVTNALKGKYSRLYYRETYDEVSNLMTKKLGWQTNLKTKPLMIGDLNKALRDKLLIVHDKQLASECQTYVFDDSGKMGAVDGCYDDRVMALAVAVQVYQSCPTMPEQGQTLYM